MHLYFIISLVKTLEYDVPHNSLHKLKVEHGEKRKEFFFWVDLENVHHLKFKEIKKLRANIKKVLCFSISSRCVIYHGIRKLFMSQISANKDHTEKYKSFLKT